MTYTVKASSNSVIKAILRIAAQHGVYSGSAGVSPKDMFARYPSFDGFEYITLTVSNWSTPFLRYNSYLRPEDNYVEYSEFFQVLRSCTHNKQ